jgi:hypothetical protein
MEDLGGAGILGEESGHHPVEVASIQHCGGDVPFGNDHNGNVAPRHAQIMGDERKIFSRNYLSFLHLQKHA